MRYLTFALESVLRRRHWLAQRPHLLKGCIEVVACDKVSGMCAGASVTRPCRFR